MAKVVEELDTDYVAQLWKRRQPLPGHPTISVRAIAQAHTADEWISVRYLERGKDLLVYFLKSLP